MPATLPTIYGGYSAMCPAKRGLTYLTDVAVFENGSEQRFVTRNPLEAFALQYDSIGKTDRDALDAFLDARLGSFDSTWSFDFGVTPTLAGVTYPTMSFLDSSFSWRETFEKLYSGSIRFKQVMTGGQPPAGAITAFPTLSPFSLVQQFPVDRGKRFFTAVNQLPCGIQWSYAYYGSGLTGFPTRALKQWSWTLLLQDADVATLEAFFVGTAGSYATFSFTDPDDGTVYPKVRWANDSLEINRIGPSQSQVAVSLVETN